MMRRSLLNLGSSLRRTRRSPLVSGSNVGRFMSASTLRDFSTESSDASSETQLRVYKEEDLPSMPVLDFFGNAWYSVPVGFLALATAISRDWYTVGVETQLAVLFMMFTGTVYTQAGGMIASSLDQTRLAILQEHQARQKEEVNALKAERAELAKVEGFASSIQTILADMDATAEAVRQAQPIQQKNHIKELTTKVLDTVAREEANFASNLQSKLVDAATAHARAEAPKLKASAMQTALEGLADPEKVIENDPVLDVYTDYITQWGKQLESSRNTEKTLTAEQASATFDKTVATMSALGFDMSTEESQKLLAELKGSLPKSVKLGSI